MDRRFVGLNFLWFAQLLDTISRQHGEEMLTMSNTLGIMFTLTTYGTWLRGDARGWIDDGKLMPPDPVLQKADRERMKYPVYYLSRELWFEIGEFLG